MRPWPPCIYVAMVLQAAPQPELHTRDVVLRLADIADNRHEETNERLQEVRILAIRVHFDANRSVPQFGSMTDRR